jgi:hypothetical protein
MGISMFIKKLSLLFALCSMLFIGACQTRRDWNADTIALTPAGEPARMRGEFYNPDFTLYGGTAPAYSAVQTTKNIAVLLPTSGQYASIGRGISNGIQMAFLQNPDKNISVSFYDMSGNMIQKQGVAMTAIATMPDIIVGPLFSEDAKIIRELKTPETPVLSFTSDTNAVGGGVMTMALIPLQSVEEITKQILRDNKTRVAIFAPNTSSGEQMAGAAIQAANLHNLTVSGLFYYTEGNSDSIKAAANAGAMFPARNGANTRAREILSDILTRETLTSTQKSSLRTQLSKLGKSETIGKAPFDAILLLGNMNDSKTVVSFLRYFEVSNRDATIYGTALWDDAAGVSDFMMAGAKYAALPATSETFKNTFTQMSGDTPSRLDGFGFDAANLAIEMLNSSKTPAAYLLDPSGYAGLDGLFRLRPSGASERALQIMQLNTAGAPEIINPAATNFLTPLYIVDARDVSPARPINLVGPGINPMDYIKIPENLRSKYSSHTFGANMRDPELQSITPTAPTVIVSGDDTEIAADPEYQPVQLPSVMRQLINDVEIFE